MAVDDRLRSGCRHQCRPVPFPTLLLLLLLLLCHAFVLPFLRHAPIFSYPFHTFSHLLFSYNFPAFFQYLPTLSILSHTCYFPTIFRHVPIFSYPFHTFSHFLSHLLSFSTYSTFSTHSTFSTYLLYLLYHTFSYFLIPFSCVFIYFCYNCQTFSYIFIPFPTFSYFFPHCAYLFLPFSCLKYLFVLFPTLFIFCYTLNLHNSALIRPLEELLV